MTQQVQLPDGSIAQFPDGMSQDAMQSAIASHIQANPSVGQAAPPQTTPTPAPVASSGPAQGSYDIPADAGDSMTGKDEQIPFPIPASVGTAAIGGLSNAGANVLEGGVDAAAWLAQKLGMIDPKSQQLMMQIAAKDITQKFRSGTPDAPQDTFTQGMYQHPVVAALSQAIPEGGMLLGSGLPTIAAPEGASALGKVGYALGNTALQGASNSLIGAGMSNDPTAQNTYAGIAAAMSPIGQVAGSALNSLAKSNMLPAQLNAIIAPINKDLLTNNMMSLDDKAAKSISNVVDGALMQEDLNWAGIRNIPGTINGAPISGAIQQVLDKYTPVLEKNQLGTLQDLQEKAQNLTNMSDAIRLKQSMAAKYNQFSGLNSTDSVFNAYKNIKNNIDTAIASKADEVGFTNGWEHANDFHRNTIMPLQSTGAVDIRNALMNKDNDPATYAKLTKNLINKNSTPQQMGALLSNMDENGSTIVQNAFIKKIFDDAVSNPDNFNKNGALLKLNNTINKFGSVLSPDAVSKLNGIKNILQMSGAVPKVAGIKTDSNMMRTITSMIGGGTGYAVGGKTGAMIGAGLGGVLGPTISNMGKTFSRGLIETPLGNAILKQLGTESGLNMGIKQAISLAPSAILSHEANEGDTNVN